MLSFGIISNYCQNSTYLKFSAVFSIGNLVGHFYNYLLSSIYSPIGLDMNDIFGNKMLDTMKP